MKQPTSFPKEETLQAGHEPTDVASRSPWFGLIALALFVLGVALLLRLFFDNSRVSKGSHLKSLRENPFRLDDQAVSKPLLWASPSAEWEAFHREEQNRLNTYGWIDRARGIVHVPIAEAMKQMIRERTEESR